MKNIAVMCIVEHQQKAEAIVSQLHAAGFSTDDISVLFPNKSGPKDFAHEVHTKAPEGALAGAGTGGLLGGSLGLLVGIGALAIPGFGPLIAAGPLLAALSAGGAGSALGGMAGGLVGLGIPEIEAKRYEGKVAGGNFLISVHTSTEDERKRVTALFNSAHAEDICSSAEAGAPIVSLF